MALRPTSHTHICFPHPHLLTPTHTHTHPHPHTHTHLQRSQQISLVVLKGRIRSPQLPTTPQLWLCQCALKQRARIVNVTSICIPQAQNNVALSSSRVCPNSACVHALHGQHLHTHVIVNSSAGVRTRVHARTHNTHNTSTLSLLHRRKDFTKEI
jgi:hypothetical protein